MEEYVTINTYYNNNANLNTTPHPRYFPG